jgi:hypothetical protein
MAITRFPIFFSSDPDLAGTCQSFMYPDCNLPIPLHVRSQLSWATCTYSCILILPFPSLSPQIPIELGNLSPKKLQAVRLAGNPLADPRCGAIGNMTCQPGKTQGHVSMRNKRAWK